MKKIIWLFGQPGSGRKTLIDSIINNSNNVKELLDICGEKISVVDLKYDRDRILDYHITDERDQAINSAINSFCKDDNEVLIIKGEKSDYENKYRNVLNASSVDHLNIEQEIVILCPSDMDVAYERTKNTEWFKANYETYINRFPKVWLDIAVKDMKYSLSCYDELGYTIIELDTTNGYVIVDKRSKIYR